MSNKNTSKHLVPENIGVKNINTEHLKPNPHNPRMLFDRVPLKILKESIKSVGILVPLTVYWNETKKSYIILDGQRRWICAIELGLKEVPVNRVAEPTLVQNIVTMFQIHKLREDWELMPTALKLEVLMNKLKERGEKKLAELTGLDRAVVSRCKKLLSYPKKYQDRMLDPDPKKRVKSDFFIELYAVQNDRTVKKMDWFTPDKFTQSMLEKYENKKGGLISVTSFREIKQDITNAVKVGKTEVITKKLKNYIQDDTLDLDHLKIKSADISASSRKILTSINKLEKSLKEIDVNDYYGEEEFWQSLEKLLKLIISSLNAVGRRLRL